MTQATLLQVSAIPFKITEHIFDPASNLILLNGLTG